MRSVAWFKKGSGTVVQSTRRAVPATLPAPLFEPCQIRELILWRKRCRQQPRRRSALWLFADRTSCHEFLTNQFRLLLSSAAYILLDSLRRLGLQETSWARIQSGTIRSKLLKIGARIVVSVRRVVLHLPTGYPYATFFHEVAARITGPMPEAFRFG